MRGGDEQATIRKQSKVLERVSDAVLSIDEEFRCTYLNRQAEALLGVDESGLLGACLWDVFPDAADSIAREKLETAFETNEPVAYERYNPSAQRWFEVRVYPDEDGLSLFFTDISERKAREAELERYERIVENLPVAIGENTLGGDGQFTYVNERLVEMFGAASKAEIREYSVSEFYVDPETRTDVSEQIQSRGRVDDKELQLRTLDGEQFWASATAILQSSGDEQNILGIIQDITERKEYEQRLDALHEATREMLAADSAQAVASIMSSAATAIAGLPLNSVYLYDESIEGLTPAAVSEEGETLTEELPILDEGVTWEAFQDGKRRYDTDVRDADAVYNAETQIRSELNLPLGDHGMFIAASRAVDDFTESERSLAKILASNAERALSQLATEQLLREQERELRRHKEFLQHTQEIVNVGAWEVNLQTDTSRWTDEVFRIHDLPVGTAVGVDEGIKFYHPDDRPAIEAAYEKLATDGEPYDLELRLVTAKDRLRWVRAIGVPFYDGETDEVVGMRGVLQDITDRRERDQELREKTRAIAEAPLGVALLDPSRENNPFIYVNEQFTSITGDGEEESVGRGFEQLASEGAGQTQIEMLQRAVENRQPATVDLQHERADGIPHWWQITIAPVTATDETVSHFVVFLQDITERKQYERRLESQRDDLKLLTQMVNHDLANDLQPIKGYTEELRSEYLDETGQQYAERILASANHAAELLQTGRDLAETMLHPDGVEESVPLRSPLETQIGEIRSTFGSAVVTTDGPIPAVSVVADQMLASVFRNLLRNAIAHNDSDIAEVHVAVETTPDTVEVRIIDNGPGIADERKEAVFGRGEKGLDSDGTGLGLYLIDTLVAKYGGEVSLEDRTDQSGSVFTVTLQRA